VGRTADNYRKKAAAYARQAESATDETMRAYLCMMRDQWLIVTEAFESTDKNESTTEEHLSNPVHSRAQHFKAATADDAIRPIAEREISDPLTQSRLAAQKVREIASL
jgi:hypothetical protein